MKRIIYKNPDNSVAVVIPAPGYDADMDKLAAKIVPEATSYQVVDEIDLPSDRVFREAWDIVGNKVQADIVKAKAVAHDRRREQREEELLPLDKEINNKFGNQAAQNAVELQRQAIRDNYAVMQTSIDNCIDETELRQVMQAGGLL